MSILALDIGTINCKGTAFSGNGKKLASASREHFAFQSQTGRMELDSRQIVKSVFEIIRELALSAANAGDPVRAISISALGESMTPVSRDRQILGNAIHHFDVPGYNAMKAVLGRISREEFYAINPNIFSTANSLVKLLWLRTYEPALYKQADKFLFFEDLIFYILGCDAATSFSQANRTLLFDLKNEEWSERLLAQAGMQEDSLPRVVPSGHVAGTISPSQAAQLGLNREVVCVVGAHDQCCNALGVGICSAGKGMDRIGPVECLAPVYAGIPDGKLMLQAGLNLEHHAVPGLYVSFIYNQAGSLVKWFRNTFAKNERVPSWAMYDHLTAEMPTEPTQLLVLPHFEPTGPPHSIEDSAGVILGLHTTTQRGEILKAIMECETFYFLESLKNLASLGVETSCFCASGGGAKSAAWLQIKEDIMGVPFERSADPEAEILGAAMIAAKAIGEFSTYAEACASFIRPGRVFEPDPKRHAIYSEKYLQYRQLYPNLKNLLAKPAPVVRSAPPRRPPRRRYAVHLEPA